MQPVEAPVNAVVFDVGRVLYQWQLRALFEKLIADPAELDWFLAHVVTEEWHFQHDAGRPLAEMVPERQAQFPDHAHLIAAYAARFITNFGAEFWAMFRPTAPVFDRFRDIVVSGEEKLAKPDPAIFRLAERRFGHRAEGMLFIDDNAANIAAAAALGWPVHHFSSAAALRQDLAGRGLIDG